MRFVGVDGCRAGWLGVSMADEPAFKTFPSVQALWDEWGEGAALVLIDIPIGLSLSKACRECDTLARRLLGPRASSIFNPPVRAALTAASWEEAARLNAAATGKRISKQGWAILPKIREVDLFLRGTPERQQVFREVHPEVLFTVLNEGQPLSHPKRKAAGIKERLAVLERHLPGATEIAERGISRFLRKDVQRDDMVDALATAFVAFHYGDRLASLPPDPPIDCFGLQMQMVIPQLA